MNIKRFLALSIAALMLLPLLASCGSGEGSTVTTTADPSAVTEAQPTEEGATEAVVELKPNIPETNDFGGYEFKALVRGEADTVWMSRDIKADEETGEAINDAVYTRNKYVEELLNVKIIGIYDTTANNTAAGVKKVIMAGTNEWDIIMPKGTNLGAMITGDLLQDLRTVPYLDLTQPWWDEGVTRDWSLGGKVYVACGDITITPNNANRIIMFNKKMIKDFGLDDPYTLVRENKWTLEKFHEMSRNVANDENGDGKFDIEDRYGYLVQAGITVNMFYGTGENMTVKDANDMPVMSLNTDRSLEALTKINNILAEPNAIMFDTDYSAAFPEGPEHALQQVFEANRGLFFAEVMQLTERMRATNVEFGILPVPKLDENQDKYYTFADSWCMTGVTIPVTNTELERTGIILEAMASKAKYTLTPAYYTQSLEGKFFRDEESREMLDIIIGSRIVSLDEMFGWGMQTAIQDTFRKLTGGFTSVLESKKGAAEAKMQKTIDAINAMGV